VVAWSLLYQRICNLAEAETLPLTPKQHQVHDVTVAALKLRVTLSVRQIVIGDQFFIMNPDGVSAFAQ
jgi:hypothetical protein